MESGLRDESAAGVCDQPAAAGETAVGDVRMQVALAPAGRTRWRPARTDPRAGLAAGGLLLGAAVALIALMVTAHLQRSSELRTETAMVDAARAAVTALLSIDHTRAEADVARVLDLSTGDFRADFAGSADDFVATARDSKAVSKGSINAAALESTTPEGGVVLIAATSEVTNAGGAREDARPFRMSVTVARDAGQFKMSGLEFVP